ncbi:hypothetical protein LMF57_17630 [Stenotrophomonas sp. SI-NJAU-1]|uniref:hypothetical protein n=1 Tax=Stenotrophomonas TaxID=40323 RepID=UPI001AA1A973|nr:MULTISPECIES: hypothetical protein [Stenotrophomonas]MBO1749167.1 hypothetical protein [Stenotrophomonas indicatrix]UEX17808.1 hypothetical protein LMF57_17630 [Stenotrophomonas sp. SI-NJAU-1]
MRLRGNRLQRLHAQRAALLAEINVEAARLAARQLPAGQFAEALMPLSLRLQAVDQQILRTTPARELIKRLREVERQLYDPQQRDASERRALEAEVRDLRLHVSNPRRRPLTVRVVLILSVAVAAALFLPKAIVALLAS